MSKFLDYPGLEHYNEKVQAQISQLGLKVSLGKWSEGESNEFTETVRHSGGHAYSQVGSTIPLRKGVNYSLTVYSPATANPLYYQVKELYSGTNIKSGSIAANSDTSSIVFYASSDEDVYIGFGGAGARDVTITITSNIFTRFIDESFEVTSKALIFNKEKLSTTGVMLEYSLATLYALDNDGYETITAQVFSAQDDIATTALAFYSSKTISAETLISLYPFNRGNGADAPTWVSAYVPSGCVRIVVVNNRNDLGTDVHIYATKSTSICHKELQRIEENTEALINGLTLDSLVKTGGHYIRYSDGVSVATGSYFDTYSFKNDNYKRIVVSCGYNDAGVAAIAFYSGSTISTDTYLGTSSVRSASGVTDFSASVPSGCGLIVVTNRNSIVASPSISIYKSVNKIVEDSLYDDDDELISSIAAISSLHILDGNGSDFSTTRFFTDSTFRNAWYRNRKIIGIKLWALGTGSISVIKGTGITGLNSTFTSETLQTFSVEIGYNYLKLTTPIVLTSQTEYLGINGNVRIRYNNVYGDANNICFLWDNNGTLIGSNKDICVAIMVADLQQSGSSSIVELSRQVSNTINKTFIFGNKPCYGHLFINEISGNEPAIPCQSLFDVDATARLGMEYIELNVHATSDGVLIPIHGVSGKFGREVTDLNGGFTYEDTAINSVTYSWIESNLRYSSKYAKHRTTIPTLEQALSECKRHGISVMMTYSAAAYALAKKYFDDNFIAYNGSRGDGFTGLIMSYSGLTTIAEILTVCDTIKPPYIHMLQPTAYASFVQAGTLPELAQAVHEKGCLLGIAGCYQTILEQIAFFEAGGDVNASAEFVNDFENGNICNLKGDADFSDFTTTGTSANGVLTLTNGQKIGTGTLANIYLGKGSLRMRFNGKLKINSFGHSKFNNVVLESDGSTTKWISTYFLEKSPSFELEATEQTEIYMMNYKASKV